MFENLLLKSDWLLQVHCQTTMLIKVESIASKDEFGKIPCGKDVAGKIGTRYGW